MGLEKNLLVNALLQKSKSESFIMGIGGETYMKIGLIDVDGHKRILYVEKLEDKP